MSPIEPISLSELAKLSPLKSVHILIILNI